MRVVYKALQTLNFYGLPYVDLKITFHYTSSSESYWEVIDNSGVKFVFGKNASARETTHSTVYEEGETPDANQDWTYISTWYLEEIIFPDLPVDQSIKFYYNKYSTSLTNTYESVTRHYPLEPTMDLFFYDDITSTPEPFQYPNTHQEYFRVMDRTGNYSYQLPIEPYYTYDKMTDPCGSGHDCNDVRMMVGGEICDALGCMIYDPENYNTLVYKLFAPNTDSYEDKYNYNKVVTQQSKIDRIVSKSSSIKFDYGSRVDVSGMDRIEKISQYDLNGKAVNVFEFEYNYFTVSGGCSGGSQNCSRLKLSTINLSGELLREFQYMDDFDSSLKLPARNSIQKDLYGYYNREIQTRFSGVSQGVDVGADLREQVQDFDMAQHINFDQFNYINIDGPSRTSSSLDARAGSLWKVHYPNDVSKVYSYEASPIGGIVTSSVKLFDGDKLRSHHGYTYSNAFTKNPVLYAVTASSVILYSDSPNLVYDFNDLSGFKGRGDYDEMTGDRTFYSNNAWDLNDHESYKSVKVFARFAYQDGDPVFSGHSFDTLDSRIAPYMSIPYKSPGFGSLKKTTQAKKDSPMKLVTDYKYTNGDYEVIYEHSFAEIGRHNFIIGTSEVWKRAFLPISSTSNLSSINTQSETIGFNMF